MLLTLSSQLVGVLEGNMDKIIIEFMKFIEDKEKLKELSETWGYQGTDLRGVIHGYIIGTISDTSFIVARYNSKEKLTTEDRDIISKMIKTRIPQIKGIVSKLENPLYCFNFNN